MARIATLVRCAPLRSVFRDKCTCVDAIYSQCKLNFAVDLIRNALTELAINDITPTTTRLPTDHGHCSDHDGSPPHLSPLKSPFVYVSGSQTHSRQQEKSSHSITMPDPSHAESMQQNYEIRPDPHALTQNPDRVQNSSSGVVDYEPHPERSIKLEPER